MALDHYALIKAFPAAQVRRLGHDRWILENSGWNDLTQHWGFQTWFSSCLSASPAGDGRNRRAPAGGQSWFGRRHPHFLLAFTLSCAFVHCHSKLVRRYCFSSIEVVSRLRRSLSQLPPHMRAPDFSAEVRHSV